MKRFGKIFNNGNHSLNNYLIVVYLEGPPKRDFIKENVKNLKLMQQHNHTICQANDTNNYEGKINPQRKIRSNSHSRLRSTSSSVRNIATSKSMEVGKEYKYYFLQYVPVTDRFGFKFMCYCSKL